MVATEATELKASRICSSIHRDGPPSAATEASLTVVQVTTAATAEDVYTKGRCPDDDLGYPATIELDDGSITVYYQSTTATLKPPSPLQMEAG